VQTSILDPTPPAGLCQPRHLAQPGGV